MDRGVDPASYSQKVEQMETSHRSLAHTKVKKLRGLAALTAMVIGMGVAGCASPAPAKSAAPAASPSAAVQVEKLNVSYIGSGTASLPLFIGLDRGYFEEAHLEITSQSFGTAPYPQAVAGEVDIISGDHVGALQAAVGGLPLVFLAETSRMIPGQHQFVTPETSRFKKPKDLKGARIGMSSLVGSAKFALDAMLEVAGLTEKDVQVSKLALDALGPALELGNIDVAHLPGTFLDAARQAQKLHTVADFSDLPGLDGLAQAGYYTTQAAYEKSPDKFKRFVQAYQRASKDAIDDKEMLKKSFITVSKTKDPAIADRLPLPSQVAKTDPRELQRLADLAFKSGLLEKKVKVGEGTLQVADFIK